LLLLSSLPSNVSIRVIELRSAYGTVLTTALNQLYNTEPMKCVIAWKLSCLCHSFLAYSAFIIASRWILDKREVDVDVFELCAEHGKLLDLVVEVYHKSVAVLNHIELG
jgi:hypothetical protein